MVHWQATKKNVKKCKEWDLEKYYFRLILYRPPNIAHPDLQSEWTGIATVLQLKNRNLIIEHSLQSFIICNLRHCRKPKSPRLQIGVSGLNNILVNFSKRQYMLQKIQF
jgi:hypothetical protein